MTSGMLLKNKTALITGGGRGFGYAIAHRFAREGCNIAIVDLETRAGDLDAVSSASVWVNPRIAHLLAT
jgi:3-hydroxybutyrate dehydrogenase